MKWLLTADLQFDSFENYSSQTAMGVTSRLRDMILCWKWMTEVAKQRKCNGIIVVGDIFDSRTVLELPVLDQVCRSFHETANDMAIHLVAGNHDSYLRSPAINSLQVFKGMATVWDAPGTSGVLGFLPWTDDVEAFKSNPAKLARKGAKFLFSHIMVKGAVHTAAGGISVEDLRPDLFQRIWLGDVHEPVEVRDRVAYIGSPMQLDYGDAGGKRGVRVFDDTNGKHEWVENTESPRFHILTTPAVEGVRAGDFVRIKTDDAEIAAMTMAKVKGKTTWVETTYVEQNEAKPRVDVRSSMQQRAVLERYCAFKDYADPELIDVGMELLEKAAKQ